MSTALEPTEYFPAVPLLAWTLYKSCKESSSDGLQSLAQEVALTHIALKESEEIATASPEQFLKISQSQQRHLAELLEVCKDVLAELDHLIQQYERLSMQSQRSWDRLGWGDGEVGDMRAKVVSSTVILAAFNTVLTKYVISIQFKAGSISNCNHNASSSQARIEKKLNQILAEVRAGQREGSIISTFSIGTEPPGHNDDADLDIGNANALEDENEGDVNENSDDIWARISTELEDLGITKQMVQDNREFIIDWIARNIKNGDEGFEDTAPISKGSFVVPRQTPADAMLPRPESGRKNIFSTISSRGNIQCRRHFRPIAAMLSGLLHPPPKIHQISEASNPVHLAHLGYDTQEGSYTVRIPKVSAE
ncbi:MAG: hypothetical protein M1829_004538 [Trizodia sp. TS-e1964]|nr:MAG: hypothetical protein M1829_004538 [Trizodia sp. TS-e1964]